MGGFLPVCPPKPSGDLPGSPIGRGTNHAAGLPPVPTLRTVPASVETAHECTLSGDDKKAMSSPYYGTIRCLHPGRQRP